MDELPELPFKRVLSYLNLENRLRLSAVSRSCHAKVTNTRVKTLCYSERPVDRIFRKSRWVSGEFAQNFINSTRFASFFDAYGHSILSLLKHLRLCDLNLRASNETALTRTLNSFSQLETLDMIRVQCRPQRKFELTLPMLTSIHLEQLTADRRLTLDAPRLREVRAVDCPDLRLEIVHGESVERLLIDSWGYTKVKKLQNLQYLYVDYLPWVDPKFLSSLQQLKEIHLKNRESISMSYFENSQSISELFKQKQRSGRADLKIYFRGLLLSGLDDPAIGAHHLSPVALERLAENPSRLADEIPLCHSLNYSTIERVAPGLEIDNVLKRCTQLYKIEVKFPVLGVQSFLDLLKNYKNVVELQIECNQPQDLFDRLPEHCVVQRLIIYHPPSDLAFLFRLKHLIHLNVNFPIDSEITRRAFEELPALCSFRCTRVFGLWYRRVVQIEIDCAKQFCVQVFKKTKIVPDLNAAIEFAFGIKKPKKRKAEELE